MLLSIYADNDPDDTLIADVLGDQLDIALRVFEENGLAGSSYHHMYMIIASYIGHLAELNQKIDGVASSAYKLDEDETVDGLRAARLTRLRWTIGRVWSLMSFTECSLDDIQAEYNRKMDKWENVTK